MRYDDAASVGEQLRLHHEMLDRRKQSTFRNVGPDNLFNFPDKNTIRPLDFYGAAPVENINAMQSLMNYGGRKI